MQKLTRLAALIALGIALTGCQIGSGFTSSRTAPVLGGALQVGVPPGYCIDGKASRESRDTAVILMGRCSDAMTAKPALITVSIGQGGSAGVMTAGGPALAAFFTSAQGRATLARSGRAGDVRIIAALGSGDAFLLHLQDRNVGEYWRAVIGVKGRLVTLSATGTEELRLDPAEGRILLEKALDALRAANKAPT
ncbi:MAG: hypothetical protein U1A24_04690 [Cypionkella sp.]|uniref:hypothetical protein n=1 Tax=Cypionkella sp. TaxID=2811411 RepID=UPI002ABD0D44|nr:hypothetical protein [Cypionkella sp.]MDZ4309839.1 hypothetical protein [Cypionkella sp.]MDZ4395699.1 hypothetical protein [Cypionkella sp.]